ncbi:MAG: thiamine pyrophosphate-requiring protein [Chloroflexi bacterium]|nr:thiamine pyrophosphate-requiring protein [Chloroflexota bacterium]
MTVDARTAPGSGRAGAASVSSARLLPAANGAEALVQLLAAHGVEYLFLNPGTDTAPIQEAIVALGGQGHAAPKIVSCLYENVALAAAHGYFCVTRRPQAVLVHVDAGTQNLGGNLHNTQRAHAGVLILAGRTPYTVDGVAPGSRDRGIQWFQDQADQPGIVRGYVKWSHELGRTDTLNYLIPRAVQVAASEPAGAVYMTVAREVLMEPMDGVTVLPPERTRPAIIGPGDLDSLETLADWLVDAEHPLLIAGDVGRHPQAVASLQTLAETLGTIVNDKSGPLNLPLSHPLFRWDATAALREADVVLILDAQVPWVPKDATPSDAARIAQIDIDPVKASIPLWGFPVTLPLHGDTSKALPLLLSMVERRATPARQASWRARRERLEAATLARRADVTARLDGQRTQQPISPDWASAVLGELLPPDAIVAEEAVTNQTVVRRHIRREQPGTLFHPIGPGLGWAPGAAVGMKLAAPNRLVVAVVGDGSFVFSSPVAALYAAQQAGAPILTVVLNNSGYNASKQPIVGLFPDGASVQANAYPGVRFQQPPDYALLAQSCHAYGERVTDPSELHAAVKRAIAAVEGGQSAVLDVVVEPI